MPCLMAWVLARRASIAAIASSMSERTVATLFNDFIVLGCIVFPMLSHSDKDVF